MIGDEKHPLLGLVLAVLIFGCAKPHATNTEAAAVPQPDAGELAEEAEEEALPEIPLREDAGVEEETEATVTDVPEPAVEPVPPAPPEPEYSPDDIKLAKGIYRFKMKTDHGTWWECGEKYKTKEEIKEAAIEWAIVINEAHANSTYKLRSGIEVKVPLKEAVGTMISESRFDRCAIGPRPREYAYKKKIVKRRPGSISHTLQEIESMVTHPKFGKRKADLGPGQIVKSVWKMSWDEIRDFLSLKPGIQKVFDEMAFRGEFYNTRHPSLYWPGSMKHKWYKNRVLRMATPVFTKARKS